MDLVGMARKISVSLIGALLLVVVLSYIYKISPENGPFAIKSALVDVAPFVVGSIVAGFGVVGLWLLNDSRGF